MKRILLFYVFLVFFTISFVGCNNQTPTKELYKLQEQCGRQSEEWFKKKYSYKEFVDYENHYNKKLNKCFILVTDDNIIYKSVNNEDVHYSTIRLFDINENKHYGTFGRDEKKNKMNICFLLDKHCQSSKEWKSLIKPYMEE